eukprot:scaffold112793_cov39-Phaeocystis_antarctica.AAC.1
MHHGHEQQACVHTCTGGYTSRARQMRLTLESYRGPSSTRRSLGRAPPCSVAHPQTVALGWCAVEMCTARRRVADPKGAVSAADGQRMLEGQACLASGSARRPRPPPEPTAAKVPQA